MVFITASLTRGIVFKIPGTVTRLPRGQRRRKLLQKVKRRAIAAGILLVACHENAKNVITTPRQVVESSIFFW